MSAVRGSWRCRAAALERHGNPVDSAPPALSESLLFRTLEKKKKKHQSSRKKTATLQRRSSAHTHGISPAGDVADFLIRTNGPGHSP